MEQEIHITLRLNFATGKVAMNKIVYLNNIGKNWVSYEKARVSWRAKNLSHQNGLYRDCHELECQLIQQINMAKEKAGTWRRLSAWDIIILGQFQNVQFYPIYASCSNFDPRNIQYIPVAEIFAFIHPNVAKVEDAIKSSNKLPG